MASSKQRLSDPEHLEKVGQDPLCDMINKRISLTDGHSVKQIHIRCRTRGNLEAHDGDWGRAKSFVEASEPC